MIGKTISHYKILEKLGEGGMGKVYKAEDTKLKRIVALKFLPHHLVAGKSIKERFFHEARAASALNHPNIITIHDIHEEEDEVFLVMECIDGVLLSEKLKDGPLKQQEIVSIATGIAEGLNAAHNADITHRDIKSENIIVAKDGQVKIIDFGLAKQKGMSQITQDGTTLGTQSYMSPEQVQGVEADQRSDIFSFGVVLYQMATGKLPFEGEHEAAVLYSIVNEAPIPVTTHNPNMDEELQRIISKALEKNVKDRYQHADDMLADLRKLKKGKQSKPTKAKTPVLRNLIYIFGAISFVLSFYLMFIKKDPLPVEPKLNPKSIVVLPFATIDRTEESEIFSDGIHDDILTRIAKIRDLRVISRSTSIQYKNQTKSLKEIAKELNVANILEGSIRRDEDRIRITAQLIDANTDEHLWAESYDREYSDIFTIQNDVALKVANALNATLNPDEKIRLAAVPTSNMEAYDYFIRGNVYYYSGMDRQVFENAIEMYKKAVELDPNFTIAFARLAEMDLGMYWDGFNYDHTEKRFMKAKEALEKAIALDPDIPEVHLAQGYYYYWGSRDYKNALKYFDKAIESQPNNSDLLAAIGYVKRRQGEWDTALDYLIAASNLDPQNFSIAFSALQTARILRNWDVAEQFGVRATLLNSKSDRAYYHRIEVAIARNGNLKGTRKILEETQKNNDPNDLIRTRAYVEYMSRYYQKSLNICNEYKYSSDIIKNTRVLWPKGRNALALNQSELAASYFDSLRILWIKEQQTSSSNFKNHFYLSMAYAGMGMKEKFLEETKLAENLMPFQNDIYEGTERKVFQIELFIWLSEYDRAIDLIDHMLSIPSYLSVNELKLSPIYDPLRDNPRFQELLKKYGEKN